MWRGANVFSWCDLCQSVDMMARDPKTKCGVGSFDLRLSGRPRGAQPSEPAFELVPTRAGLAHDTFKGDIFSAKYLKSGAVTAVR